MENERPQGRHTPRMISTLATCARRYQIEYADNCRPKGRKPQPWPPKIKPILRDALRDRDFAEMRGLNKLRVRAAAEAVITAYRDELLGMIENVGREEYEQWVRTIADLEGTARGILSHYEEVLGDGRFSFLLDKTGRPLVDRVVEEKLDDTFTYADRIDGVLDRGTLPPAVLVRRFTSNSDPQAVANDLELDLRLPGAMWIASRAAGEKITSAVVEVLRTKAPSVPETIQCRKCGGQGGQEKGKKEEDGTWTPTTCETCGGSGIGGMSKRACDTTYEEWHRAAVRAGLNIDTEKARCKDVLSRITGRGETFAYRITVDASEEAIHYWKRDTGELLDLSRYYEERSAWPRNSAACVGRAAPCPYRKPCSYHGDTDVAWFIKQIEPFPGLD